MSLALDHLVIAAVSLDEGAAWFEAHFGVALAPGGQHPLMGTHNRLLRIAGPQFPQAYLEVIAIDPAAPAPGRRRWFDLDDEAMQARLRQGPALVHWATRCADIVATGAALRAAGFDTGEVLQVSRGTLRWQIAVRPDGRLLAGGAVPTPIQWGEAHPADSLPECGVRLDELRLHGLPAPLPSLFPEGIVVDEANGAAPLSAVFSMPRGRVQLDAPAIARA